MKFVLVKGRYGMGGRLNVMLGAWNYALSTNRALVVDWTDGYYGAADCFSIFFENKFLSPKEFYRNINNLSVFPEIWSECKIVEGYQELTSANWTVTPPKIGSEVEEDVVVVTWVDNFISDERLQELARKLTPNARISAAVDSLLEFAEDPIGVHYRHGNGEAGVICPDVNWFIREIKSLDPAGERGILLCTDSAHALRFFKNAFGERLIFSAKDYPQKGALHNNRLVVDKVRNGEDALVDLYALGRCQDFIESGEFFGKTAKLFGAGTRHTLKYPGRTRLFNSQVAGLIKEGSRAVSQDDEIGRLFLKEGIDPTNMYVLVDNERYEFLYGVDVIYSQDIHSLDIGDLKAAIFARRLYV